MNSLSNHDHVQTEVPSNNTSQTPLIIVEDITLDGCRNCEQHAPANCVKVNCDQVSSDDIMDIQKQNLETALTNDVEDQVCDLPVAEENLSKSTCSQENKPAAPDGNSDAEAVQRQEDTMANSTPSSSQTSLTNDVENQVCDVPVAEENLTESTCSLENKAAPDGNSDAQAVQRQENIMANSTPSSSQTTVIPQFENGNTKLSLTTPLPGSCRRKLLVLDVNGLLADIVPIAYVSDRYKPDTTISGKAVFKRPFCDEFLEFCFRRFSVGIWSSRTKRNVDSIVDFLMGKVRNNLLFCWDQSHCTSTGYNTVENSSKPLVLKELKKLWEKKSEQDLPWEIGEYNESNTLLLDDSPYKALCNPSNTAIFPHSYQYRDERDNSLGPGGGLYVYLEGLAEAADVQTYVKQNPFGQQPITKENSSWDFYLKVMECSKSTPSQSAKYTVKSESVDSQSKLTSSGVKKLEEFVDNKCNNQEFPTTGSSHEVPEITNALRNVEGDSASGSLKQEELKRVSGMLEVDEVGRLVRETTVCDSGGSPSWVRRGIKRSRSRSPVRGISPSRSRYPRDWRSPWGGRERHGRSHSLNYERCRSRSRSPSYRRGGEFGGDVMRRYKGPPQECRDFMRGKCYRGASCWYVHHESDMTDKSRSFSCRQQYENVPPSSDINGNIETSTPGRSGHPPQECRDFMRGKCCRGASCWYVHHESDMTDKSRSFSCRQQYENVPPSSDINENIETSPPERSGHEHGGFRTLVMEERKGMKEELCKFTNQVSHKMRRYEAFREECRDFVRGKCHRGASCRYLHHEYDRSSPYMSKQQYQDVTLSSKRCDVYWGTKRTIPLESSVHEPQDLRQEISIMWKAGIKEELGKCSPRFCDKKQKPWVPECHHFMRGNCSFGAKCWYPHNESDRRKEQYQNDVPSSLKSCDNNGEIKSIDGEISVDEHKQDLEQMEVKEEVGESTTQPCDRGSNPEACVVPVPPHADADADSEREKVPPNDVAECLPAADPVEM